MSLLAARVPYCRSHDLFTPVEEYAEALRRSLAYEAYWLRWDSSFDGTALIRVSRLGNHAMASRLYRKSFKTRHRHVPVGMIARDGHADGLLRA